MSYISDERTYSKRCAYPRVLRVSALNNAPHVCLPAVYGGRRPHVKAKCEFIVGRSHDCMAAGQALPFIHSLGERHAPSFYSLIFLLNRNPLGTSLFLLYNTHTHPHALTRTRTPLAEAIGTRERLETRLPCFSPYDDNELGEMK